MARLSRMACGLALCGVFLAISGCPDGGASRVKTYPVSGTVMYNGTPLEGATVSFWLEGAARPATGISDKDGKFKLSTWGANDGAQEGAAKITVTKAKPAAANTVSAEDMLKNPAAMAQMSQGYQTKEKKEADAKPLVPAKYADAASTPLTETVTTDGEKNQFVLQLVD